MRSRNTPLKPDARPSWGKVIVSVIAGVGAGGVAFLALLRPITLLLDQLIGRVDWQSALTDFSESRMLLLRSVFWVVPFGLGQWCSALISGWSKTIYFAAAVQTFHMVMMFSSVQVAYLWVLPWLVAAVLIKLGWASSAAEKGRLREAKSITLDTKV